MAKIAIKRGEDEHQTTYECLKLLNPELDGTVLIKPNFFKPTDYPVGAISRLDTICATVDYVHEVGCEAWVGEGGLSSAITDLAFKNSGLSDYCEREDVKLFNFFKEPTAEVEGNDFKVKVAKPAVDADHIISLCKLKVHTIHGVSLSGKNLMGCVVGQRRVYFHSSKGLANLISLLISKFKIIGLIDGIVGMGYCEGAGIPTESGMVLAGDDLPTLDAYASRIMGFDLDEIPIFKHLTPKEFELLGDAPVEQSFIKPIGWGS